MENGIFDVYHIPNEFIYNQLVNKTSTFKDFQDQGKRPRFSIYKEIIEGKSLLPVAKFDLFDENTILNSLPMIK